MINLTLNVFYEYLWDGVVHHPNPSHFIQSSFEASRCQLIVNELENILPSPACM